MRCLLAARGKSSAHKPMTHDSTKCGRAPAECLRAPFALCCPQVSDRERVWWVGPRTRRASGGRRARQPWRRDVYDIAADGSVQDKTFEAKTNRTFAKREELRAAQDYDGADRLLQELLAQGVSMDQKKRLWWTGPRNFELRPWSRAEDDTGRKGSEADAALTTEISALLNKREVRVPPFQNEAMKTVVAGAVGANCSEANLTHCGLPSAPPSPLTHGSGVGLRGSTDLQPERRAPEDCLADGTGSASDV